MGKIILIRKNRPNLRLFSQHIYHFFLNGEANVLYGFPQIFIFQKHSAQSVYKKKYQKRMDNIEITCDYQSESKKIYSRITLMKLQGDGFLIATSNFFCKLKFHEFA